MLFWWKKYSKIIKNSWNFDYFLKKDGGQLSSSSTANSQIPGWMLKFGCEPPKIRRWRGRLIGFKLIFHQSFIKMYFQIDLSEQFRLQLNPLSSWYNNPTPLEPDLEVSIRARHPNFLKFSVAALSAPQNYAFVALFSRTFGGGAKIPYTPKPPELWLCPLENRKLWGHFGTKFFKVTLNALLHTLSYGPEILHGHWYSS